MKKLVFKSNTEGKLKKLLDGSIFQSNTTFITELFQNAQRARAKNVEIRTSGNTFVFSDDGVGLKNPQGLMTFDYSEWESTDEGFGIGFWSVLAIDNLEKMIIESNKYIITCNVSKLREIVNGESKEPLESVLSLLTLDTPKKGFKVTLISDFFECNSLVDIIEKNSQYLDFDVYLNGRLLDKRDLFDDVEGDFTEIYNTRLFSAKLSVTDNYKYPSVFYENRKVCDLYGFPYVSGVIKLKSKALNLREPDRTEIIKDTKYLIFSNKLRKSIKDLYKEFLEYGIDDNLLENYEDGILEYLSINEFEKYLKIDDIDIVEEVDEDDFESSVNNLSLAFKKDEEECEDEEECAYDDNSESNKDISENKSENIEKVINNEESNINKNENSSSLGLFNNLEVQSSNKNDIFKNEEYINADNETERISINTLKIEKIIPKEPNKSLKAFIKSNKSVVWVEANLREYYKKNIALAEYYGIKVLVSKNLLTKTFFIENGVDYITSLDNKVRIEMNYKDMKPKTDKEVTFLKMLEPVRIALNLPSGFFKIANISKVTTIDLNNKRKVVKEKSSGEKIAIYATSTSNEIIFDRTALSLKKFNLSSSKDVSIGKNELKCLMYNMDTIAHELAHTLYGTTDNTKEHFYAQSKIQEELVKLYIKY